MNLRARNIHRDLGYFYIGLIISFALSGILMNHREQFHAEKYNVETKNIEVKIPKKEAISEDFAKNIIKQFIRFKDQKSSFILLIIEMFIFSSLVFQPIKSHNERLRQNKL